MHQVRTRDTANLGLRHVKHFSLWLSERVGIAKRYNNSNNERFGSMDCLYAAAEPTNRGGERKNAEDQHAVYGIQSSVPPHVWATLVQDLIGNRDQKLRTTRLISCMASRRSNGVSSMAVRLSPSVKNHESSFGDNSVTSRCAGFLVDLHFLSTHTIVRLLPFREIKPEHVQTYVHASHRSGNELSFFCRTCQFFSV